MCAADHTVQVHVLRNSQQSKQRPPEWAAQEDQDPETRARERECVQESDLPFTHIPHEQCRTCERQHAEHRQTTEIEQIARQQ